MISRTRRIEKRLQSVKRNRTNIRRMDNRDKVKEMVEIGSGSFDQEFSTEEVSWKC